jgi:hypothetical protein
MNFKDDKSYSEKELSQDRFKQVTGAEGELRYCRLVSNVGTKSTTKDYFVDPTLAGEKGAFFPNFVQWLAVLSDTNRLSNMVSQAELIPGLHCLKRTSSVELLYTLSSLIIAWQAAVRWLTVICSR